MAIYRIYITINTYEAISTTPRAKIIIKATTSISENSEEFDEGSSKKLPVTIV